MKQLKYNDASFLLRLQYPSSWQAQNITGVTVGIKDLAASELLAAQDATIFAGTLTANASATAMSISVTSTAAPTEGQRYRIHETTAADVSDNEDIVIRSMTDEGSDVYILYLESELKHDHNTGEDIKGCFCTYTADLSDTDVFTSGLDVAATWTPVGTDDFAYKEIYEIAVAMFGTANIWERLKRRYKTEWEKIRGLSSEELTALEIDLQDEFKSEFRARGMDINRVVDQDILNVGMLRFVRRAILSSGGDNDEYELKIADAEWSSWFRSLTENNRIWTDTNKDEIKTDNENQSHGFEPFFRML